MKTQEMRLVSLVLILETEAELALSKNTSNLLTEEWVRMQIVCWTSPQYPKRDYLEMPGISTSVANNQLEEVFCKIVVIVGESLTTDSQH